MVLDVDILSRVKKGRARTDLVGVRSERDTECSGQTEIYVL